MGPGILRGQITIREIKPEERDQMSQLMFGFGQYLESIDNLKRIHYAKSHEPLHTDQVIKKTQENNGKVFVADLGGQIIGFIAGFIQPLSEEDKMTVIPTKPGIISELYIDIKYQGQGIGTTLMQTMEQYLRDKGCDVVKTSVFAPNKNAREFYDSLDYQEREIELIKKL